VVAGLAAVAAAPLGAAELEPEEPHSAAAVAAVGVPAVLCGDPRQEAAALLAVARPAGAELPGAEVAAARAAPFADPQRELEGELARELEALDSEVALPTAGLLAAEAAGVPEVRCAGRFLGGRCLGRCLADR